jgi:hypothetical protein
VLKQWNLLLLSPIVTLVLGNEVLEETDIIACLVSSAIGVDNLCIHSWLGVAAIGQISPEFSVRLIMVFLSLSSLVNNSCTVEFNRSHQVLHLVFLVERELGVDQFTFGLTLGEMLAEVVVVLVLGVHARGRRGHHIL